LATVARIGQDLLVAVHGGIKDRLARYRIGFE
jgi:hypothetical protein